MVADWGVARVKVEMPISVAHSTTLTRIGEGCGIPCVSRHRVRDIICRTQFGFFHSGLFHLEGCLACIVLQPVEETI